MATDPGYPAPRGDRGAVLTAPVATAPTPPVTRVFPFTLQIGTSVRSSRSTPKLYGPAIVMGLHAAKSGTAKGFLGIGLGKSLSAITETGVAVATPLPFTSLFEGLPAAGTGPSSPNNADVLLDVTTNLILNQDHLGIIIREPEFFLVVYAASSGASANDTMTGHVTVQERVSPEVLALFL
jgi:hypothetical protein